MDQFTSKTFLPENSSLGMLDRNGVILYRFPDAAKWIGTNVSDLPNIKAIMAREEGVTQAMGMDGTERLYAFKRLDGQTGVGFAYVGIREAHVFAEAYAILFRSLALLGFVTVLSMLTAWSLGARFIMKPINDLMIVVEKVASGDLNAQVDLGKRSDEMGRLAKAFNEMAAELRHREAEHNESEERLRKLYAEHKLILDSVWEGIFVLDMNGNHTFVNSSAAKMLGYEIEELIGTFGHSTWHHSRADGSPYPEADCPIHYTLKDGQARSVRDDIFWRRDGRGFPAECMTAPIVVDGAVVGAVVSFLDVTEPRNARKELEVARERLELALAGGALGLWDLNVRTGEAVLNEQAASILGYLLTK